MNSSSLEIQLAALIALHGREPVIKKLRSMTAKKAGRPRILDWEVIWSVLEEDAADILQDRDPLLRQTNTSIAKKLARANPMQSCCSTIRRIQKKLSANRLHYAKVLAAFSAASEGPYQRHIDLLKDLTSGGKATAYWTKALEDAQSAIAGYVQRHGDLPAQTPMAAILAEAEATTETPRRGGFGAYPLLSEGVAKSPCN